MELTVPLESPENDAFDAWYGEDSATLGDRIAAAREAAGLSAKALAQNLGVKTETLARWEEDRADPRANRIQMMAGILGVSLSWLLTGKGEGPDGPVDAARTDLEIIGLLDEVRRLQVEIGQSAGRLATLEKALRRRVRETV
jgi:transcriptional regulator with XRE-family HTH domain